MEAFLTRKTINRGLLFSMKTCTKCKQEKTKDSFQESLHRGKRKAKAQCKQCESHKNKERYNKRKREGICVRCGKNPPEQGVIECRRCKDRYKKNIISNLNNPCSKCGAIPRIKYSSWCSSCHIAYKRKRRLLVYEAYGGIKCNCCGEDEELFLSIDHVNNDGYKEGLNSQQLVDKLIRENFPEGYQILCRNCNYGKHLNGGTCPHVSD